MAETIDLPNLRIDVEERPGYLFMIERGALLTKSDVDRYGAVVAALSHRRGVRKALIDARDTGTVEPSREARDALVKWLMGGTLEQIAFVVPNEMTAAQLNMIALSHKANARAFETVHEAQRWLLGRQRTSSSISLIPAQGRPHEVSREVRQSDRPPPPAAPARVSSVPVRKFPTLRSIPAAGRDPDGSGEE